ncbi:MAG TPA: peptide ABC transporter substrate-binding protein [Clostridium sp.]|nr:peptide ABC transporter substrate-binding protein [Clostridium sp.]
MNIRNYIKKFIFLMLPLITVLFFYGCSSKGTGNNELILGTTISTKSIDPAKDYCGWYTARYGVSETLFKLDESMNIIPNLALSYENIDKYTWKIILRDDVTFQNGEKMTPEKVKLSLERAIAKNNRAKETLNIKKIYTEDSNLFIKTNEPHPTIINDLCDPFASIIDVDGTQDFDNAPIGTGPFKVERFDSIKSSYYSKYENYWQGEPALDKIKVIKVSDSDTLAMALQTGELDVAEGISYSSLELFEKRKDYKIEGIDTSRVVVLYYNYKNKYLNDVNLRKSINLVINKEEYCEFLLGGAATPSSGAFPQSMDYSIDVDYSSKIDLEKANEILDANGYIDIDKDGIREKDGEKIEIKLVTYSSRAELPILAQAIQSDLKKIGIDMHVEVSDSIMDKLNSGDFDVALYSNVTASTGDGSTYLNNLLKTNGDSNYGSYSDNQMDNLLNELNKEFDPNKRAELEVQIQKKAIDEDAFNFIAHMKLNFVMKSNVMNFEVNPTDYYEINYKTEIK